MMDDRAARSTSRRAGLLAGLALVGVVIACLWKMAFTDLVLPRGDTFYYIYPYWDYRARALQTGRIPLWEPYLFMGAPFLANSQAGVLYPPNWLLAWLDAPTAVRLAVIAHIVWAGLGALRFGRRLGLGWAGAWLAGLTFALGGYLTAQIEHVNQLQGLAWMPWLFVLWDEASRPAARARARMKAILWLGLALAMQLLAGHTQSAFVSGVGLGVLAICRGAAGFRRPEGRRYNDVPRQSCVASGFSPTRAIWPLGALALGSILALAIGAAQVLPALELAGLSTRGGGLPPGEAVSFSLHPLHLGRTLLPDYPGGGPLYSEYVAYLGVAGLMLAGLGAWQRRREGLTLEMALVAGVGVFLALGKHNPLFLGLLRYTPGFNLFRAPARFLALWAFGAASLAGLGLDTLLRPAPRVSPRQIAVVGGVICLLIGLATLAPRGNGEPPRLIELAAWAVGLGLALALIWLAGRGHRTAAWGLVGLVSVELFAASLVQPFNRQTAPGAYFAARPTVEYLLEAGQAQTPPARFLSISDIFFDPGDIDEIRATYSPRLPPDAVYDYIIATKGKEILAPNLPLAWGVPSIDGYDGGLLPLRQYVAFEGLFVDPTHLAPDGRLRENLDDVPPARWLSLANVRWVITDKVIDAWVDGVLYDLQFTTRLTDGDEAEVGPVPRFLATSLGLVTHLEGAPGLADGAEVGWVLIEFEDGERLQAEMLAGRDTAEALWSPTAAHAQPQIAGRFTRDDPDRLDYLTYVEWDEPRVVTGVRVRGVLSQGEWVMRGLSLVNRGEGAFQSLVLAGEGRYRLAFSGDVKVYDNLLVQPRAFVVHRAYLTPTPKDVPALLRTIRPDQAAVIEDPAITHPTYVESGQGGRAEIVAYAPERVVIRAESPADGYLILTDAYYPGWRATLDGEPVGILRADVMFRAVRLPAGEHEVVFTYRSRPFEIGVLISLMTLAGVIVAFFRLRR
jgi:type IV secretory pathway VirB2 component (pilin)